MIIANESKDRNNGGAEETRTPYLGNANAALYQVSYSPVAVIVARQGPAALASQFVLKKLKVLYNAKHT